MILWHRSGQPCIRPSMKPFLLAFGSQARHVRKSLRRANILWFDMNLIAGNGHRKWAYRTQLVTAVAAIWLIGLQAAAARPVSFGDLFASPPKPRGARHASKIPLPKSRPAEAPAAEPLAKEPPGEAAKPAGQAAPTAPQLSACRQALTEDVAIAPSIPDIHGPGGCGGEDLVRLEAIVLPDKRKVPVKPAAILRCGMASAIADWVRTDMTALANDLGSTISDLDNFDSFECRGRNRVAGAMLSEHGRANALDVRAFKLANGRSIGLTDRSVPRGLRERVLHSVCSRFTTVLGPGSDWYHEDHIHLDLMQRRNDYRICQWNVWDSLPQVAPVLPAERPEEAPPREVAAKSEDTKDGAEQGDAAKSGAPRSDKTAARAQSARKPPTKKR